MRNQVQALTFKDLLYTALGHLARNSDNPLARYRKKWPNLLRYLREGRWERRPVLRNEENTKTIPAFGKVGDWLAHQCSREEKALWKIWISRVDAEQGNNEPIRPGGKEGLLPQYIAE